MTSIKFSEIPNSLATEKVLEQFIAELEPAIQNFRNLSNSLLEAHEVNNKAFAELKESAVTIEKYILSILRYVEIQIEKRKEIEQEKFDPCSIDTTEDILVGFVRELRSPLGYIKGYAHFGQKDELSGKQREEFITGLCERVEYIEEVRMRVRDNWKSWVKK